MNPSSTASSKAAESGPVCPEPTNEHLPNQSTDNSQCDQADVSRSCQDDLRDGGSPWNPSAAFEKLAQEVIAGKVIDKELAKRLLNTPDRHLLKLLDAAYQIRHHFFQNKVLLNYLVNAKSGLCPEDCNYCSQANGSEAEIEKYRMMDAGQMVQRAKQAVEGGASTCCLVISGRGPSQKEVDEVAKATEEIKQRWPDLKICACLGLLKDGQAETLKQSGVDRYNHNLNTAPDLYKDICSTHSFEDRKDTVQKSINGGLSPCSGLIAGMNETDDQLLETLVQLRNMNVDSIPVNFLVPIEGTPLSQGGGPLTPQRCLKILCVARFMCPDVEIRCSAGREKHLRHLQPMSLYPANSWFVADYLTTKGQEKIIDHQMIEDLGFEIQWVGEPPITAKVEPESHQCQNAGSSSGSGSCGQPNDAPSIGASGHGCGG